MRLIFSPLLIVLLVGCSGQRSDALDTRNNNSEADGGSIGAGDASVPFVPPVVSGPSQNVVVGVNGGQAQSARFRAQVLVSFPNQPAASSSSKHSATLLPRPAP